MTMATVTGLELFTYRVGFGDCFLLRFEYADGERRSVLIDFGKSANPEQLESQTGQIAAHVKETCGKRLDAIVATHRHSDHVSEFKGEIWKTIRALEPRLVVLPWTEHPDAATDATVAPSGTRGKIGSLSCGHVQSLAAMQEVAAAALKELARRTRGSGRAGDDDAPGADDDVLGPWTERDLGPMPISAPVGKRLAAELQLVGELNLDNAEQLKNLLSTPAQDFVSFGSRTRLEKVLRGGVKVHVLGPPTLAQTEKLAGAYRKNDPTEYWLAMAAAGRASARANGKPLFPGRAVDPAELPLETRWFLRRLDAVRTGELLQIVRTLDVVLNNTSVILLFEILGPNPRKLLFPGDAQIESWEYALEQDAVKELLKGVDVYKVGHHGSRNATPKTMWNLFEKRGPAGKAGRLRTVLSTRRNKHPGVPRAPLVEELGRSSDLLSTLTLRGKKEFVKVQRII